ncbi:MAG TPA: PhoU domain-containing protein [Pseudonocardiaceae bacterium]|jgi:phosphate transport system protein|nr:PhoU domain-containing protein [Pseudonocardiaceae bacterium]
MCATFHAQLDELIIDLVRMTRLAGQMMTNAAIALHQADVPLTTVVMANRDQMNAMHDDTEQGCIALLVQQAPDTDDARAVVAILRAVRHLKRMGNLARHVAVIARLKHPNPMMAAEVRPVLARMSLLASQFAEDAAATIERHDRVSASQLAEADHEVNSLRRHLFSILFAADWSHGVEQAVDAALIGRYYERFADHAVAVAAEARYLTSCRLPGSPGVEAGSRGC